MRQDLEHLGEPLDRGDDGGAWILNRKGIVFQVIASWGGGWDHVSVSMKNRIPSWDEMCWIKSQFFEDGEVVMQLHPAKSNYVNIHDHCLHLWRPQHVPIPTPPLAFV